MRFTRAVQDFLTEARLDHALHTIRAYSSDLGLLVSLATVRSGDQVASFTPALMREYFDVLSRRGNGAATLLRHRAALTAFATWCLRRRLLTEDPMLDAPRMRRPKRLPRPLSREERARLLALELDPTSRCLRALLYWTGLRVSPICALRLRDVTLGGGGDRLGQLRSIGKGDKEHIAYILPELEVELIQYVDGKPVEDRHPNSPLLTSRGRALSVDQIEARTRAWGREAGVEKCTPHRFRHTFATVCFEKGLDPRTTQRLLGHANLATTMTYLEVSDAAVEQAVRMLSTVPLVPAPAPENVS